MKNFLSLLILLILSSCAAKKLAVRNADNLIQYQIEKKIPLYTAQKEKLGQDISRILTNLKPEVKKLIPLLKDVPLDRPEGFDSHYQEIDHLYHRIESDFTNLISKNLAQLDKKQQKDFLKNMADDNKEIADKSTKKKKAEMQKNLETLLGSVTDKQKEILGSYEEYFSKRSLGRIQGRETLLADFTKIYNGEVINEEGFHQAFREYQKARNKDLELPSILKKFIPTLNPEQKMHLKEKFEEAESLVMEFLKTSY
jgi:hypothetical protein